MRLSLSLLFLFALLVAGCQPAPEPGPEITEPPGQRVLERVPGMAPDQGAAAALVDGELALVFLDEARRVAFRRGDGPVVPLDEDATVTREGGKYLSLYVRPEGLFALWWQKQTDGAKHLYLRRSDDGGRTFAPAVKLNTDTGVLPVYFLASDGEGRVAVVYYDERRPTYMIYVTVSTDGGVTWLDQDIRLDVAGDDRPFAIEPQLAFHQGRLVVTWKERLAGGDGTRLMARSSGDGGREWDDAVEIARFADFFTADALIAAGADLVLFGYVPERGLLAFVSRDAGQSWVAGPALGGTETGLSALSQVRAVADGGQAVLVFTVQPDGRDEYRRTLNPQVYSARFDVAGGDWVGEPVRLDTGKPHNLTTAINPKLVRLGDGLLVAAWEDYRDIRANIYLSHSIDGGATWSDPVPVGAPGRFLLTFPRLLADEGREVRVLFDRFHDDARTERALYALGVRPTDDGWAGLSAFPEVPVDVKAARLRERAESFWALRTEGRHAEVYDYFDPGLRSRIERDAFVASQGRMIYHEFEVLETPILGNVAGVVTRTRVEVPPMRIQGEEFQMEPREDRSAMEWVWVGDDWYAVFAGTAGTRFLRY